MYCQAIALEIHIVKTNNVRFMENTSEINDTPREGSDLTIRTDHPKYDKVIQYKKAFGKGKNQKIYTITVLYVKISEEEAKTKRSLIESIIRKGYFK